MVKALDAKILAACTHFSHRLQRLTGITNYSIAKVGIGISALSVIIMIINYFYKFLAAKDSFFIVVFGPIILLSLAHSSYLCDRADSEAVSSERAAPKIRKLASNSAGQRIFWLVAALVFTPLWTITFVPDSKYPLLEIFSDCYLVGITVFDYFANVDSLPPGRSKAGEWLGKFRFGLGLKQAPAPTKD